jgi:hypothetical protein
VQTTRTVCPGYIADKYARIALLLIGSFIPHSAVVAVRVCMRGVLHNPLVYATNNFFFRAVVI